MSSESQDRTSARNSPNEIFRAALRALQTEIHTSLKGVIVDYDADTKRADVQISQQRKHTQPIIGNNAGNVEIPVLRDMPVHQPVAGGLSLGFEPKAGDECMVFFSEREIETAKEQGGTYELKYSRMHDLSDGVVIPFCFTNEPTVSLLELFQDLLVIVREIALSTTPSQPQNAAAILAIQTKLESVL